MAIWEGVDWDLVYEEALAHFKTLIRFETVNPPGNERPAAEYLAEVLKKEGIEPEVLESAPGRANLVCRIPGSGEKAPVLLHGHLDVVPVEPDKWSVAPFGAVEKDGFLWGRGAFDMKNMVTMCMMCMLLFKRAGITPKRDLIFCAVADEEAGGQYGSQFMVDNHPDKVKAEYAIGEMGGFSMEMGGVRFYLIQVAEKGMCWLKIKTHGDPGHGSMPDPDSAPIKAATVIDRLGKNRLPQHNPDAVVRFVNILSSHLKFPQNMIFKLLLWPGFSDFILDKLFPDKRVAKALAATIHNTANPTVIRAGEKTNVIPSVAEFEVDGRILPGFSTDDFIAEVRKLIGDEPEIEVMRELTPTEAPVDDPVMGIMSEAIHRHDPEAVVVPNLGTWFSDATHWKKLGIKCYGFIPLKFPPDFTIANVGGHGHDERIPLEGFRFGLEVLFEAVEKLVTG